MANPPVLKAPTAITWFSGTSNNFYVVGNDSANGNVQTLFNLEANYPTVSIVDSLPLPQGTYGTISTMACSDESLSNLFMCSESGKLYGLSLDNSLASGFNNGSNYADIYNNTPSCIAYGPPGTLSSSSSNVVFVGYFNGHICISLKDWNDPTDHGTPTNYLLGVFNSPFNNLSIYPYNSGGSIDGGCIGISYYNSNNSNSLVICNHSSIYKIEDVNNLGNTPASPAQQIPSGCVPVVTGLSNVQDVLGIDPFVLYSTPTEVSLYDGMLSYIFAGNPTKHGFQNGNGPLNYFNTPPTPSIKPYALFNGISRMFYVSNGDVSGGFLISDTNNNAIRGLVFGEMPYVITVYPLGGGEAQPCFLEGTRILCKVNPSDKLDYYVPIEQIKKGTLVKTSRNGYKKVVLIGKASVNNTDTDERTENRLYKLTPANYPELKEDLYITGHHSVLVDSLTEQQKEDTLKYVADVFGTDGKARLMARVDDRAVPWQSAGTYTIWHFALETADVYKNFGVYANGGLLVETCCIKLLKEEANMTLV
jgi:hypothetical protein